MSLLQSPLRNLVWIVTFMLLVVGLATAAYMSAGWNFRDAIYMVTLTIFGVGYGEVQPVDTPFLRVTTIAMIVLGCTGMIFLTSGLVQYLTINQLQQFFGLKRVQSEIDKLTNHAIIVGFGRIGLMLSHELKSGAVSFVIVEQSEQRAAEARALGHLTLLGDATDEAALLAAGIQRARLLATVLPNDAANVFITLSARSLNPKLEIIARGELPSTESKLRQAGADKVVLPTHIGAERIAELILFPETARLLRSSERMRDLERTLRDLGLDVEVIVAPEKGALTGLTVGEIEERARGRFFILQLHPHGGEADLSPDRNAKVGPGDGVVIVGRSGGSVRAMFEAPAERTRAGRNVF